MFFLPLVILIQIGGCTLFPKTCFFTFRAKKCIFIDWNWGGQKMAQKRKPARLVRKRKNVANVPLNFSSYFGPIFLARKSEFFDFRLFFGPPRDSETGLFSAPGRFLGTPSFSAPEWQKNAFFWGVKKWHFLTPKSGPTFRTLFSVEKNALFGPHSIPNGV